MAAGGGDLEGSLGVGLTADLREVDVVGDVPASEGVRFHARRLDRPFAGQPLDRFAQASKGEGREGGDVGGLAAVGGGEEEAVEPLAAAGERDRQDAPHRLDLTLERELADPYKAAERLALHQSRGGEDSQRDREVEGSTFLAEIRWGQADSNAFHREGVAGVPDGAPDAITALANRGIGEPDHVEGGEAGGDVHLHRNERGVDPHHGGRKHPRQHGRDCRPRRRAGQRPESDTA